MTITRSAVGVNKANSSRDQFKTPLTIVAPTGIPKPQPKISDTPLTAKTPFVCSICKNSELLKQNSIDINTKTLLGKFEKANKSFSESMSKIESLGLNIRHLLLSSDSSNNDSVNSLLSLKDTINDLITKTDAIKQTIDSNEKLIKGLTESLNQLQQSTVVQLQSTNPKADGHQSTELNNVIIERLSAIEEKLSEFQSPRESSTAENFSLPHKASNSSKGALFTIGHDTRRIISHGNPKPTMNPMKAVEAYHREFLPNNLREKVAHLLADNGRNFKDQGTRKTISFGEQFWHQNDNHNKPLPMPPAIQTCIDSICGLYPNADRPNSVTVNKFTGSNSILPERSDNEWIIKPESLIFTMSLGDSCNVVFTNLSDGSQTSQLTDDSSLLVVSQQSQGFYSHKIPKATHSTDSVSYSLTFRHVGKQYLQSTLVVEDPNTKHLYFPHERNNSYLAKLYGKRIYAPTIDNIEPIKCTGYGHIILHVGINNLNNRHGSRTEVDVSSTFDQWLTKIIEIRNICTRTNLIISPILPKKSRILNSRAKAFNSLLFSCINSCWTTLDFTCFVNDNGLLDENYSKKRKPVLGRRDSIHLSYLGIAKLATRFYPPKLSRYC